MTDEQAARERRERIRKRKQKKESALSAMIIAVAAVLLMCVIVLVVIRWDIFSPKGIEKNAEFSDSTKQEATVSVTGSAVLEKNFRSMDSGLVYISDTSLVKLNHDCERVYSEKHSYTNPLISSSGDYAIAYSVGSGSFRIICGDHRAYEGVQGTSITECAINSSGTYAVLSDQTGYLSSLNVFDKNNKFIYSYSFSDFYAVTVSISEDGSTAAVGAVNSADGRLVSKVYLLDLSSSEPVNIFTYEDQLVYDVEFVNDDHVAVITDMITTVIKADGSKEIPYSYSSRLLTAYDVCYGSGIVLSLSKSEDGRSCSVVTLNDEGGELGSYDTDLKIISVDASNDRAAILSYGRLDVYTAFGDLLGEWEVGSDAKSVLLPQNKTAYILGVSGITKMSLK